MEETFQCQLLRRYFPALGSMYFQPEKEKKGGGGDSFEIKFCGLSDQFKEILQLKLGLPLFSALNRS